MTNIRTMSSPQSMLSGSLTIQFRWNVKTYKLAMNKANVVSVNHQLFMRFSCAYFAVMANKSAVVFIRQKMIVLNYFLVTENAK